MPFSTDNGWPARQTHQLLLWRFSQTFTFFVAPQQPSSRQCHEGRRQLSFWLYSIPGLRLEADEQLRESSSIHHHAQWLPSSPPLGLEPARHFSPCLIFIVSSLNDSRHWASWTCATPFRCGARTQTITNAVEVNLGRNMAPKKKHKVWESAEVLRALFFWIPSIYKFASTVGCRPPLLDFVNYFQPYYTESRFLSIPQTTVQVARWLRHCGQKCLFTFDKYSPECIFPVGKCFLARSACCSPHAPWSVAAAFSWGIKSVRGALTQRQFFP